MTDSIQIKEISSLETYSVRHPVLREGRPIEDCSFDGDDLSTTFHLGLFYEDVLVGVASFMKNNHALFTWFSTFGAAGIVKTRFPARPASNG